jgi:hypothetical protein
VNQAKFTGKTGEPHGLQAPGMIVKGPLLWYDAALENGAQLDLTSASVEYLVDRERSWPALGNLLIDGFTYSSIQSPDAADAPADAHTRLRWLGLQPGFHPQPYRQLAKVLREAGDESGAVRVLIAEQDARYRSSYLPQRFLAGFLKFTIGYGHRPLLALLWSFGVVLFGWAVTRVAKRAGLMRPTYPENAPIAENRYERLYPLLYSLDVFLPFVNLHQEHYWWPDSQATGELTIFGLAIRVRGSIVLYYLWLQIIAGWLLSAIFIAGVTGLIRND